jgi:threonylcarbamoyladenosine tRNA methylthiotransferase MtaB
MLRCSYCIIPKVRPRLASRPICDVVEEVRRLLHNGYREIVLTGVHLGHYGVDWNWRRPKSEWIRLSDVVREIVQIEGDFRIRLSSLEATEVTRELVDVMAGSGDKVCPHLHLCLQSGSDAVLRRMKRRWSARSFIDRCRLVQESLDQPAFTTDVMVGFPGETDEDFDRTCEVVQEVGFSKIHVFPFSPRQGTPAAEMPNRIPKRIKRERMKRLSTLEQELRKGYFEGLVGRSLCVLVESPSETQAGHVVGTSCRYAPVELPGGPQVCGKLVEVVANAVADGRYVEGLPI